MDKKFLISSLILAFIVAVFHSLAIENSWYWLYWWMDVLMHVFGGLLIGLLALAFHSYFSLDRSTKNLFVFVIVLVLVIGVGWEIFEYTTNVFVAEEPFPDAFHDLFADLAGGLFSFVIGYLIYGAKNKKIESENDKTH